MTKVTHFLLDTHTHTRSLYTKDLTRCNSIATWSADVCCPLQPEQAERSIESICRSLSHASFGPSKLWAATLMTLNGTVPEMKCSVWFMSAGLTSVYMRHADTQRRSWTWPAGRQPLGPLKHSSLPTSAGILYRAANTLVKGPSSLPCTDHWITFSLSFSSLGHMSGAHCAAGGPDSAARLL